MKTKRNKKKQNLKDYFSNHETKINQASRQQYINQYHGLIFKTMS